MADNIIRDTNHISGIPGKGAYKLDPGVKGKGKPAAINNASSSPNTVVTHIAGESGLGPIKMREVQGARGLNKNRVITKTTSGHMLGSHGHNGGSKCNNMNQTKGNSVGRGVKTPGSGASTYRQAGPKPWGHARQPKKGSR